MDTKLVFLSKTRFDNEQWKYICEAFGVNPDCYWFEVECKIVESSEVW